MRGSPFAVALAAAALSVQLVSATDYHVAGQLAGASDSNTGLSTQSGSNGPWRTIRKAVDVAGPGDTVYVHNGDYRSGGVVTLNADGQPGSPIRFVAASGQNPIVQGFSIRSRRWIVVEGFTIRNGDFNVPSSWRDMPARVVESPGIAIDPYEGWSTRQSKVRSKFATYMSMIDQWNSNWRVGVDVKASTDIVIRGNDVSYYTLGIELRERSSRVTVEENTVHHCRTGLMTWRATPSLTDSAIVRNIFRQNLAIGADVREYAEDVRVEDNLFENQGTSHIHVHTGATRVIVKNNMARYGGYYSEAMENPGSSAINFNKAGSDNIAEGNIAAYHVDDTQLDGSGFIIDLMYDTPVTIRNNIAYRNSGSGVTTTRTGYCTIVNNTFIENGYLSDDIRNGAGVRFAKDEDRGHIIANNIFLRNRTAGVWTYRRIADVAVLDGNLYHQPTSALVWDGGSTSDRYYTDLAAVRSATGREANGLAAEPQLVSSGEYDYHLSASSPARSAALAVHAPVEDFEGDIRDGSPDIGHDEYSGTDSTPPAISFVQPNGDGTAIEIDFSEPISPATAEAVGNYRLDGGALTLGATLAGAARVRLQTSTLETGRRYALTVEGVSDLSGNATPAGTKHEFDFVAASEMTFQNSSNTGEMTVDVELSNSAPNQNLGVNPSIGISAGGGGANSVGLLEWDLSGVPVGSEVVSGELEFEVTEGSAARVEAFGLLRDWQEPSATWMQPAAGEAWDVEGAAGESDRSGASSGVGAVSGAGRAKIRLNENGLALVQSWVDGEAANHGFVVSITDAGSAEFVSSEGSAETLRPRLVVRYQSAPVSDPPPSPSGLTATAIESQTVTLAWDAAPAAASIDSYRVFQDGAFVGSTPTPTYMATGLAADSTYAFHVTAVDANGLESEASATITARTLVGTMSPPTALSVTSTTTSSITLSWNPSVGAQQYRIYRDGAEIGSATATAYTAGGLNADTTYGFYVTAVAGDGRESAPSNSVSARTQAGTLAAPSNLAATSTGSTSISLAWSAPSGGSAVSSYRIYQDGVAVGAAASTSFTASGLKPDTRYSFSVTALGADGSESAASNTVNAQTQPSLAPPVVESITMSVAERGGRIAGRVHVLLLDAPGGNPVGGATLIGYWTVNGKMYDQSEALKTNGQGIGQSSTKFPGSITGVVGFVVTGVDDGSYRGPIGPYSREQPLP